jgi:hypothetical protein
MRRRLPIKVETVKQIVVNWGQVLDGQVFLFNKRFKSAHQAAKFYAEILNEEYFDRYGWRITADTRQERLRRRLVPVFKNMLK